jgi:hypothetical protein
VAATQLQTGRQIYIERPTLPVSVWQKTPGPPGNLRYLTWEAIAPGLGGDGEAIRECRGVLLCSA